MLQEQSICQGASEVLLRITPRSDLNTVVSLLFAPKPRFRSWRINFGLVLSPMLHMPMAHAPTAQHACRQLVNDKLVEVKHVRAQAPLSSS